MKYGQIVFLQDSQDAAEPLRIFAEDGPYAAVEYLAQWDPGYCDDIQDTPSAGKNDDTYLIPPGYILTVNQAFGYIGLERCLDDAGDPLTLEPVLLLDENRGIYIPQIFGEMYAEEIGLLSDGDWLVEQLKSPEKEFYWDAMQEIENNLILDINGIQYRPYQNGDLWLIPRGMDMSEGSEGWYF